MADQVQALRALLNAGGTTSNEDLRRTLDEAIEMVGKYLTDNGATVAEVPSRIMERATQAVAREMFTQEQAPNGFLNQQFDDGTSTPIRISADPLRPAYALLGMWVDPVSFA